MKKINLIDYIIGVSSIMCLTLIVIGLCVGNTGLIIIPFVIYVILMSFIAVSKI